MGTTLVSGYWVFPEKLFSAVKFGGRKAIAMTLHSSKSFSGNNPVRLL